MQNSSPMSLLRPMSNFFFISHTLQLQSRLATPNAPKKAPTHPRSMVSHMPEGIGTADAPLKGTNVAVALGLEPPVPPPVKFWPLAPMGRELSVNAQVLDVHRHCPAIGSQKGVEQLVGKRKRAAWPLTTAWSGLGLPGDGSTEGHP